VTDRPATISTDVLATYAADAAREVAGVRGLSEGHLPGKRGVRVTSREDELRVELHLVADWGAPLPELGRSVQQRVREYLHRMAAVESAGVDVVVEEIGPRQ
jgi:uncharacterized alkaline shock family protein YloU